METNAKQQVVERVKEANNILITVSANPTLDQLSAAIGFTLLMTKLNKHSTAVFSGEVPHILEFLHPETMIEKTTDSLRDFIISLDKSKADKLRYKVEDEMVKIFITPYRTSLSDKDLEFSQGDFNVDVIIALGVVSKEELDQAIVTHGRILHDATVISVLAGDRLSNLGSINWQDTAASSLCEMLVSISESFGSGLLDNQIATAFLTGIVAETERFKNEKTTPKVLTMSAQLVAAGANQQLVATELEAPPEPEVITQTFDEDHDQPQRPDAPIEAPAPDEAAAPRTEVDVMLSHDGSSPPPETPVEAPALDYDLHHDDATQENSDHQDHQEDEHHDEPPAPQDPSLIEISHSSEEPPAAPIDPIRIDEHGNIVNPDQAAPPTENPAPAESAPPMPVVPPLNTVTPSDVLSLPSSESLTPHQTEPDHNAPANTGAMLPPIIDPTAPPAPSNEHPAEQPSRGFLPAAPEGPAMSGAMEDAHQDPPDATDILNLPPLDGRQPDAPHTTAPAGPVVTPSHEAVIQPPAHQDESTPPTAPPVSGVDTAREAVMQAITTAPYDAAHPEPIQALNATPVPMEPPTAPAIQPPAMTNLPGQPTMPPAVDTVTAQPPQIVTPTAPPPATPPPLMPPIITRHDSGMAQPPADTPPGQPPATV